MRKFFERPVIFPALTTALFVIAFALGVMAVPQEGESVPGIAGHDFTWLPFAAKSALAAAFLALAAWFLHAFTQCDERTIDEKAQADRDNRQASMFRFAYLFSLFSFALLVLPFTAMLRTHESPPDAGPIRLLRACVQPSAPPASGVTSPVDLCPDPMPKGLVNYPWLVAVGGVVAQECGKGGFHCSAHSQATTETRTPLYSVTGGFVVPFYVVVFSFVGGVVNLTRRVPEYQKRSSCHFEGTATESVVTLLEAREFVVFQIMQLLSAPFVAMVAYYAVEPKSIASAVGLAFVSGFSTEAVLLLIRGMVNGLKPEGATKTAAASGSSATARLHVLVKRGDATVAKAKVEVRRLPSETPAHREGRTNAAGAVEFVGLAPGSVWVVVTPGDAEGTPPRSSEPKEVKLVAGQTESVEIAVN
jgi:hypothetical protein